MRTQSYPRNPRSAPRRTDAAAANPAVAGGTGIHCFLS